MVSQAASTTRSDDATNQLSSPSELVQWRKWSPISRILLPFRFLPSHRSSHCLRESIQLLAITLICSNSSSKEAKMHHLRRTMKWNSSLSQRLGKWMLLGYLSTKKKTNNSSDTRQAARLVKIHKESRSSLRLSRRRRARLPLSRLELKRIFSNLFRVSRSIIFKERLWCNSSNSSSSNNNSSNNNSSNNNSSFHKMLRTTTIAVAVTTEKAVH